MGKTHIVFNDRHCAPGLDNSYHDLIAKLIIDVKPDVVIDNGDGADMPSLCSYDRNTRAFQGRNYRKDVGAAIEGNDRIWSNVKKAKKKLPLRVTTIGNHEQRINKAINLSPELDGAISIKDLQLEDYYDVVVPYAGSTPGIIEIDGIYYAHYLVSGIKGLPIGGENPANMLLAKQQASCTVGHSHVLDFTRKVGIDGKTRQALVNGCLLDHKPDFAGHSSRFWWSGITIKRNVENGSYDPEFVSLQRLRDEYQ